MHKQVQKKGINNVESITPDRFERMQRRTLIHLAMEAKKTLDEIRNHLPVHPEAMEYFYERCKLFYDYEYANDLWQGKKLVAYTCIHVPDELVRAAGAIPVRICSGAYSADQIGAEFLPTKSCPIMKSTAGMAFLRLFRPYGEVVMMVIPTTCDQKTKFNEIAGEFRDDLYILELPPSKESEESRVYWQRIVKRFAKELEKKTGHRITRRRLKAAMKTQLAAQATFREFYQIRKDPGPLIWGTDAILALNIYFLDDPETWTSAMKILIQELLSRKEKKLFAAGRRSPRILLTGTPLIFPNMKLSFLIEQLGGIIVADETCSSNRLIYDMAAFDEGFLFDMVPAIADRYLKPCTCPNFTPDTDRERKILEMIKAFSIDGVIYQFYAGCVLYEMAVRRMGIMLEERGVPMLYVETDYSPDDIGQLSTRIEAFLESIKAKKRGKRRRRLTAKSKLKIEKPETNQGGLSCIL